MINASIRTNRWVTRTRPRPDAPTQVVCLPSAGAGPSMYGRWGAALGARAEVVAVSLPGRESRTTERAATDLSLLARRIAVALLSTVDRPYVLFGHSMGALLAYTLARVLPEVGGPAPVRLVMSAVRPPDLPLPAAVATNADSDLVASLRRLGGMPDEILADTELLELLLDPLRTDLAAVNAFQLPPGGPPSCPVALVAGAGDTYAPPAVVAGWRRFLAGPTPLYALPGNHFYLREPINMGALRAIVCGDRDPAGHARAVRYHGFTVEPFDGDEAALAALSAARLPARPAFARETGRNPLRLAVRDGGRLVAYAACGLIADGDGDGEDVCHTWVLVHPEVARRGLGGLLLGECQAFAVAAGRHELATATEPDDDVSAAWLAARGFHPTGVLDISRRTMWRLRRNG